jgi:putative DNA methylase
VVCPCFPVFPLRCFPAVFPCPCFPTADLLNRVGATQEPVFLSALEAVLEVLPPSRAFTGIDPLDAVAPAAGDFEALENLRRLAFADRVDRPTQLGLWEDNA